VLRLAFLRGLAVPVVVARTESWPRPRWSTCSSRASPQASCPGPSSPITCALMCIDPAMVSGESVPVRGHRLNLVALLVGEAGRAVTTDCIGR